MARKRKLVRKRNPDLTWEEKQKRDKDGWLVTQLVGYSDQRTVSVTSTPDSRWRVERLYPSYAKIGVFGSKQKAKEQAERNPLRKMPGGSVRGCMQLYPDKASPGAYCASIADKIEPGWRSPAKKGKKTMKKPKRPGRRRNPDVWDAEYGELQLYIDNDYPLHRQKMAIEENLKRKVKSGRYDPSKAPKLWMYLIDAGATKYCKEFGCDVRRTFPKKDVREPLAVEYARDWKQENKALFTKNPGRRVKMSKVQAVSSFEEAYLPGIEAREGGRIDKPGRREAWNVYVDGLQKDGLISEAQASTWLMPAKFERKRRVKKNPTHTRRPKPARKKRGRRALPYARERKGGGRRINPKKPKVSMRSIMAKATR